MVAEKDKEDCKKFADIFMSLPEDSKKWSSSIFRHFAIEKKRTKPGYRKHKEGT